MTLDDPQARRRALPRPTLTPLALNLIVMAWLMAVPNSGFWSRVASVFQGQPLAMIGFGAAVAALAMVMLSLVSLPFLHRAALALLIVVAAGADHFQRNYGVLIDRDMIQNAMLTTPTESKHLLTAGFVTDLVLWGLLPAALVFWPKLRQAPWKHRLWRYPLAILVSVAVMVGLLMLDFKTYSAAVREHRDMMGSWQPGATVASLARYGKLRFLTSNIVAAPLGRDAKPGPMLAAADKPVLLVVYAGETARAANFGLDGYARDTTPELAAMPDIINFPDTSSCGTSTAVSLPCMFSALPQADYTQKRGLSQENLFDVLGHAGLSVEWFDNNTGDQGIGVRGKVSRVDATLDPAACAAGECTDAAFLPILRRTMDTMTGPTVLVLHMIGSHGPAYYLRYPKEAEAFTPACNSSAFADCTNDQIVNAYDNSIRYTDYILAETIRMMKAQDRVIPAMLFMSDHGESLGEGGLYLHAAPMFMAPDTQRKVPFVMWLSDAYQKTMGIDRACLVAKSKLPTSHDALFHSVLGLLDIQTEVRQPALDLTDECRPHA